MGWRDLIQKSEETLTFPWVGGRSLRADARTWTIEGKLPAEHGWYEFKLDGRRARLSGGSAPGALFHIVKGYLVGDRLVSDGVRVDPDPIKITGCSESVNLIEPGLERFARVTAGRTHEGGALIYEGMDMPLGPEEAVLEAFLDQGVWSVDHIPGVPPALDAAFRMEAYQRAEAIRRRAELERLRREEEEKRQREERRAQLLEQLGDGAGRRQMAILDFAQAAAAALAVGGATYLDHRKAPTRGEMIVTFRFMHRRFQCVCDTRLHIVDSGICLTAHYDDGDFEEGTKGDGFFTLESLPSVIKEANEAGKLVVYRHVD